MLDDRHTLGSGVTHVLHFGALDARACIVEGQQVGPRAHRHALQTDADTGRVHHVEHQANALFFLADQLGFATVVLAEDQLTGGRTVDAHLVFDAGTVDIVKLAQFAIGSDAVFRNHEQTQALSAGRGALAPREHQVHNVVHQVMLAARDKDLLSTDKIFAVSFVRTRRNITQRGAGLRLGEAHRATPLASDHFVDEFPLHLRRAVAHQ